MEKGLIDRFKNTKKVNFFTKLKILFVLISCFSTSKVVNYRRLIMKKFPIKMTAFLAIEIVKEYKGYVLIMYCSNIPNIKIAKLI